MYLSFMPTPPYVECLLYSLAERLGQKNKHVQKPVAFCSCFWSVNLIGYKWYVLGSDRFSVTMFNTLPFNERASVHLYPTSQNKLFKVNMIGNKYPEDEWYANSCIKSKHVLYFICVLYSSRDIQRLPVCGRTSNPSFSFCKSNAIGRSRFLCIWATLAYISVFAQAVESRNPEAHRLLIAVEARTNLVERRCQLQSPSQRWQLRFQFTSCRKLFAQLCLLLYLFILSVSQSSLLRIVVLITV